MNPVAALPVVPQESNKAVAIVEDIVANNVKCSRLFAPSVERKPWYLSNQLVTSPSIAVTASGHVAIIGKSL